MPLISLLRWVLAKYSSHCSLYAWYNLSPKDQSPVWAFDENAWHLLHINNKPTHRFQTSGPPHYPPHRIIQNNASWHAWWVIYGLSGWITSDKPQQTIWQHPVAIACASYPTPCHTQQKCLHRLSQIYFRFVWSLFYHHLLFLLPSPIHLPESGFTSARSRAAYIRSEDGEYIQSIFLWIPLVVVLKRRIFILREFCLSYRVCALVEVNVQWRQERPQRIY